MGDQYVDGGGNISMRGVSGRYRVEVVEALSIDPGAALQRRLNSIGYNEQVKAILPIAETGGWTTKYLIVIEPLSFT